MFTDSYYIKERLERSVTGNKFYDTSNIKKEIKAQHRQQIVAYALGNANATGCTSSDLQEDEDGDWTETALLSIVLGDSSPTRYRDTCP